MFILGYAINLVSLAYLMSNSRPAGVTLEKGFFEIPVGFVITCTANFSNHLGERELAQKIGKFEKSRLNFP